MIEDIATAVAVTSGVATAIVEPDIAMIEVAVMVGIVMTDVARASADTAARADALKVDVASGRAEPVPRAGRRDEAREIAMPPIAHAVPATTIVETKAVAAEKALRAKIRNPPKRRTLKK